MREALGRPHDERTQFLAPGSARRGRVRPLAAAAAAGRVRRPGAAEGAARGRADRGDPHAARRSTTSCWSARRASGRRPRVHRSRGARRRHPHGRGACDRAQGRPGCDPHVARGARRPVHRRDPPAEPGVEEILYPALEDFRLDIVIGQGPAARTLTLDLPPFTLIGATTRTGLLTTPLRDRFGMTFRLALLRAGRARRDRAPLGGILGVDHLRRRRRRDRAPLARHSARRQPDPAPGARRRRGAPRRRDHHRDRARGARAARGRRARASSAPTASCSRRSCSKFAGGPVGLSTLAVALGEEPDTIEDVYEPYLLQLGFIQRTPRGRDRHRPRDRARRRRPGGARRQLVLVPELWVPGFAGPLDDLVDRIHRRIEQFAEEAGVEQASSRSSLPTGPLRGRVAYRRARLRLRHDRPHPEEASRRSDRPDRVDQAHRAEQGRRGTRPARLLAALVGRVGTLQSVRWNRAGTAARASSARARARAARGRREGRGRRTRSCRRPRRPRAGLPSHGGRARRRGRSACAASRRGIRR